MILLSRLNGTDIWLSPHHIESVERTPDTIVTLTNGHKYVVRETPEEICDRSVRYYQRIGLVAAEVREGEST